MFNDPLAISMLIDIFSERGYHAVGRQADPGDAGAGRPEDRRDQVPDESGLPHPDPLRGVEDPPRLTQTPPGHRCGGSLLFEPLHERTRARQHAVALEKFLAVGLGHPQVLRGHVDELVVVQRRVRWFDVQWQHGDEQLGEALAQRAERTAVSVIQQIRHGIHSGKPIGPALILAHDAKRRQAANQDDVAAVGQLLVLLDFTCAPDLVDRRPSLVVLLIPGPQQHHADDAGALQRVGYHLPVARLEDQEGDATPRGRTSPRAAGTAEFLPEALPQFPGRRSALPVRRPGGKSDAGVACRRDGERAQENDESDGVRQHSHSLAFVDDDLALLQHDLRLEHLVDVESGVAVDEDDVGELAWLSVPIWSAMPT